MFATDRVRSGMGGHEKVYKTHFDSEGEFKSRVGSDPDGANTLANQCSRAKLYSPNMAWREATVVD